MWLPKLERDLLAYYYKKDCSIKRWVFDISEPMQVDLDEVIKEYGYKQEAVASLKIDKANADLEERKLATAYKVLGESKYGIRNVELSIEGKDLGRKYSHILDRIGLWCAAKEHQWLWYLITLVIGFLGGLLLQLLL